MPVYSRCQSTPLASLVGSFAEHHGTGLLAASPAACADRATGLRRDKRRVRGIASVGGRPHYRRRAEIGRASGRESEWSSDVCSSDLWPRLPPPAPTAPPVCAAINAAFEGSLPSGGGPTTGGALRSEERRVGKVSGVQTCALPISGRVSRRLRRPRHRSAPR